MTTVAPNVPELPPAPQRQMSSSTYPVVADTWAAAINPWTLKVNLFGAWIGQQIDGIAISKQAAQQAAAAAADSASAANSSKNAAAEQVGLAADQVALAAAQVALADAAKADAQAAAIASGAAAGLPPERVPFSVLQINAAGAVSWGYGLPDRAAAKVGQSLMLGAGKVPSWGYAGQQLGDTLITSRNPGSFYLPADGSIRLQTENPTLFGQVGLIGGTYATAWSQVAAGVTAAGSTAMASSESGTVIVMTPGQATLRRSTDKGLTWNTVTLPGTARPNGSIVTDGAGNWLMTSQTLLVCLTSSDDGITWVEKAIPSPGGSDPYASAFCVGVNTFMATYAAGTNPTIRTADGGTTWNLVSNVVGVREIVSDRNGLVLMSATDGIHKSTNGGVSFGSAFFVPASPVAAIATDKLGNWLMLGASGTNLYRSLDNAATFTTLTLPSSLAINTYESPALFYDNVFLFTTTAGKVWEVNKLWSPSERAVSPVASRRLNHAGAGVFVSVNTGATTINRSAPTYGYDSATQFALPNLSGQAPVGTKAYIKALEAA